MIYIRKKAVLSQNDLVVTRKETERMHIQLEGNERDLQKGEGTVWD